MPEDKKDKEPQFIVVKEIPQQPIRELVDEKGASYELKTVEEAIQEILELVRHIKKAVA